MHFGRLHLRRILLGLPVPRPAGGSALPVHTLMHGRGSAFKRFFKILSRGLEGWEGGGRTWGCPMTCRGPRSPVGASSPLSGMVGGSGTMPRPCPSLAPPRSPCGLPGRVAPPAVARTPQPGARTLPRSPGPRCCKCYSGCCCVRLCLTLRLLLMRAIVLDVAVVAIVLDSAGVSG